MWRVVRVAFCEAFNCEDSVASTLTLRLVLLILNICFVENVPDTWDESEKSNNATNHTPGKLLGK